MKKMKNPAGAVMALILLAVFATAMRTGSFPTLPAIRDTIEPVTDVLDKILSPVWEFIQWIADLIHSV